MYSASETAETPLPTSSGTPARSDGVVEKSVHDLINGNESERQAVLDAVEGMSAARRSELGSRLRQKITGRFSADSERNFAEAIRDPKQLTSARSWMITVLIACDPAHPETISLLGNQISESYETDQNVRFWTLANCYLAQLSQTREFANGALSDSAPQVAVLARAIISPDDKNFEKDFRAAAASENFEAIWPYLRAMRVVGLPALVPILVPLLELTFGARPLVYDALYAMANPAVATIAGPLLQQTPGLARLVQVVMEASVDSKPAATLIFARVLSMFDRGAVEQLVSAYLENEGYRENARRILRVVLGNTDPRDAHVSIVGYATDVVGDQVDQLGFAREVAVLTALMMSREAVPPLAIGLFGSWGSGKSFFMRSMQQTADALALRAANTHSTRFCANIVQIKFNAWHYTDTSLWASLATYILEALNAHFAPVKPIHEQQTDAAAAVAQARQALELAEAAHQQVLASLAQDQISLAQLQTAREAGTLPLSSFSLEDVSAIINSNSTLKTLSAAAVDSLGLPKSMDSMVQLANSVQDAQRMASSASSLLTSLFRARTGGVLIIALVLAVSGIPLLAEQLAKITWINQVWTQLGSVIVQAGLIATALTHWIKQGVGIFFKSIDNVNQVRHEIERILKAKTPGPSEQEKLLDIRIVALKKQQEEIALTALSAQKSLAELTLRAARTAPTALLKQFLAEKLGGDDYRKHLGLVATVRSDFDRLGLLLASQNMDDVDAKPIERVILYIDDLDRCPAPKVVEVLQAVHLLLAYPLFVVVVGVDSRWLIQSLTSHYRQLGGASENTVDADWMAAPQRYLEKIFQISYAIKPMDSNGFENLIGQLMANHALASRPTSDNHTAPVDDKYGGTEKTTTSANASQSASVVPQATNTSSATQLAAPPQQPATTDASQAGFPIEETAMTIHPLEMAFAKTLHAFILSPRAAKRLTNIYRVLKAGLSKSALEKFEGDTEVPGQFQVPMLLLAILIHDTASAERIFNALLFAPIPEFDLPAILNGSRSNIELVANILVITSQTHFPRDPNLFRYWIPKVARFSFGTIQSRQHHYRTTS